MSKLAEKTRLLLELVKFEHSIFALPYAYIGALYGAAAVTLPIGGSRPLSEVLPWIPESSSQGAPIWEATPWVALSGWPTWQSLLAITVVMVGARAFAFVVNRAVDKEIDARNPRTASRAVPAGLIKAGELWAFSAIMLAAYLVAVWQLAPITRWLSPIPLIAFVIYPYTKRFTWLCHYWLGLCLGLAPVGGWVAVGAPISHPAPWVFGAAVMIWTAGFDIIYATMDYECDIRDGIHSVPADLGIPRALLMTRVLHLLTVVLFVTAGLLVGAGWAYHVAIAVAAILLAYENSIVSPRDLSRVDAAFFTFNGVMAMVIFAGVLGDRLFA